MIPPVVNIEKEKCLGCNKFILTHNKIMTCSRCKTIGHAKFSKSMFEFNNIVNSCHCFQWLGKPLKYNPFSELPNEKHDPNSMEDIEDLQEISKILENCDHYGTKAFNKLSHAFNKHDNENLSLLFNNIDGCATNFDTFASDIVSHHKHLFSVIGIAETDIDQCHKDLYCRNN